MKFRLESCDDGGEGKVRLIIDGKDGESFLMGVFSPVKSQDEAQVAELNRIAALPSLPEKTLNRPRNLPIHNWFWMGVALICAGLVIAAPYFIR